MAAVDAEERRQLRMMAKGKFDEEELPVWARMTPAEKAERGIQ